MTLGFLVKKTIFNLMIFHKTYSQPIQKYFFIKFLERCQRTVAKFPSSIMILLCQFSSIFPIHLSSVAAKKGGHLNSYFPENIFHWLTPFWKIVENIPEKILLHTKTFLLCLIQMQMYFKKSFAAYSFFIYNFMKLKFHQNTT